MVKCLRGAGRAADAGLLVYAGDRRVANAPSTSEAAAVAACAPACVEGGDADSFGAGADAWKGVADLDGRDKAYYDAWDALLDLEAAGSASAPRARDVAGRRGPRGQGDACVAGLTWRSSAARADGSGDVDHALDRAAGVAATGGARLSSLERHDFVLVSAERPGLPPTVLGRAYVTRVDAAAGAAGAAAVGLRTLGPLALPDWGDAPFTLRVDKDESGSSLSAARGVLARLFAEDPRDAPAATARAAAAAPGPGRGASRRRPSTRRSAPRGSARPSRAGPRARAPRRRRLRRRRARFGAKLVLVGAADVPAAKSYDGAPGSPPRRGATGASSSSGSGI
ncbi:single-stranded DNA-dependent ATPase [Aureococcus anophagefferens]|uniref:Single-stranded DNA-dependent ATPase n=1 Tax=Aureococcus anophagefferens TaxID=44056 RepID=A0ABR1G045_AURAN